MNVLNSLWFWFATAFETFYALLLIDNTHPPLSLSLSATHTHTYILLQVCNDILEQNHCRLVNLSTSK